MDQQQQETVLRSIAVSAGLVVVSSTSVRQEAFRVLEDFKAYDGKIPVCLQWLHQERIVLVQGGIDVTVSTKLLACSMVEGFLVRGYSKLSESDRLALRHSVLTAARQVAPVAITPEARILGNKLSVLLSGLMVRDFPQRWTTFFDDVYSPIHAGGGGGLWCDEAGEGVHIMGVKICLETLRLVAEDCTDSDFNAKISTARRNDVLTGLNEVSGKFLPLLFALLEHYSFLVHTKQNLHNMRAFLLSQGRNLSDMTTEESSMYRAELNKKDVAGKLIEDCLVTLTRFCHSMPLEWILGKKHGDFFLAFLHLLREPMVQVQSVLCLEQLAIRKLDNEQWFRLLTDIPVSIKEATQAIIAEQEQQKVEMEASGNTTEADMLTMELGFHRAMSRMLAMTVSTNISHVTNDKQIMKGKGERFQTFSGFLRLLVDLLHHPSGRICGEQINTWIALLRDPQFTKLGLLTLFAEEILTCYMNHVVRIRWSDIEEGRHPHTALIGASWDDEEEYDSWIADLRSKTSQLFKFLGNVEPKISAAVMNARIQHILTQYGNGEPRDHLNSTNNQLTPMSEAVIQFEGLYQPLENMLSGLPSWALDESAGTQNHVEIRREVRQALSQTASSIVSWNPTYIWLKFRRATLLDALKHYWKHEPSTVLQGIDSLLSYMNAPDDWTIAGGSKKQSGEIIGLRKKSGVALVAISKKVPHHLVPWLSQLSEATRRLMSSADLLPPNRMHLYEFLSCVATAVEDPVARANFVADVLSDALGVLESPEVKQTISSVESFMSGLGLMDAKNNPSSVTDPSTVKKITDFFVRMFSAFNQLLSVGKRCHEAAKKRPNGGIPAQNDLQLPSVEGQNFPDEGPVSLTQLAMNDPFVPLWPRILPCLLQVIDVTLKVWHPSVQATLLTDKVQRYVFAISDDEAYLAKVQDGNKSGGVFGEGGTAGSVVSGTDRRDLNLVPRWSGWFNELRNTCFQLLGLMSGQRALYAPEMASLYPLFVSIVVNQDHLRAMEHRHITQMMKQFIDILLLSCPATLYASHLGPILRPFMEHLQLRLEKTWAPIVIQDLPMTRALGSPDCAKAAESARRGGEEWFVSYYARAGVFVGDLDTVTAEAAVDKFRVDLSRTVSDMLQSALALKGDWALVLANQAKEEQALKRKDSGKLSSGPKNRIIDKNGNVNADGTPKLENQAAIDARKKLRINKLCHFLLLEDESIAGFMTLLVIQSLEYPDAYTVRRCARICHRILETVAWSTRYTDILATKMFVGAIKNIVTEPKWMVGIEWDMINLVRDILCRLVLGQTLLPGGQGPGMQQPADPNFANQYEQAKTAEAPLQGGGIIVVPSGAPKNLLARLPGISAQDVEELCQKMRAKRAAKDQKDLLRDLLRVAAENSKHMNSNTTDTGLFGRALETESLLNQKISKVVAVPDIPEKLVTHSMVMKNAGKGDQDAPQGLGAFQLFG